MTRQEYIWFVQGYMLTNQENIPSHITFDEACDEMWNECNGKSKPQLQEYYNLDAIELEETIALGRF